ncbi:fimbrial protein [Pseudomonas azotoformans]|uniref:fimbrial protein n=1 Tax=Pseudomonas azotoformans TaxID=47878 RepID=UPI00106C1234|nr:fimbrial protein [Pseudomonas azotoformans]
MKASVLGVGFLLCLCSVEALAVACVSSMPGATVAVNLPATINYVGGLEQGQFISSGWSEVVSSLAIKCSPDSSGGGVVIYAESVAEPVGKTILFNGVSYDIFRTATPGVGVIAEASVNGTYFPLVRNKPIQLRSLTITTQDYYIGMRARVQLVAYTALSSGSLKFTGLPELYSQWQGSPTARQAATALSVSGTAIEVKNKTCKLSMPAIVKLPNVDVSRIQSINSTSGDTSFTIVSVCEDAFADYQVNYTLTDVNNVANTTSVLSLEKLPSAAAGLGLQILDNNMPLTFSPSDSLTARKPLGSVSNSQSIISKLLTVRYVRTKSVVTPGIVRAGAAITLSYQ